MACSLDWDLRHFDVEQAFIQSDLDTDIYLRLTPRCSTVEYVGVRTQIGLETMVSVVGIFLAGFQFRAMLNGPMCVETICGAYGDCNGGHRC